MSVRRVRTPVEQTVRRSKSGATRPRSCGGIEIPTTMSMEVLAPEPSQASLNVRPASASCQPTEGSPKKSQGSVARDQDAAMRRSKSGSKTRTPTTKIDLARTAPAGHAGSSRESLPGSAASSIDGPLDRTYGKTFQLTGVSQFAEDPEMAEVLAEAEASLKADDILGRTDEGDALSDDEADHLNTELDHAASAARDELKKSMDALNKELERRGSQPPTPSGSAPQTPNTSLKRLPTQTTKANDDLELDDDRDDMPEGGADKENWLKEQIEGLMNDPIPADEDEESQRDSTSSLSRRDFAVRTSNSNPMTSPESSVDFDRSPVATEPAAAAVESGDGTARSSSKNPLDNSANSLQEELRAGPSYSNDVLVDDSEDEDEDHNNRFGPGDRPEDFDSDDEEAVMKRLAEFPPDVHPRLPLMGDVSLDSRPSTAVTSTVGEGEKEEVRDVALMDDIDALLDAQEKRRDELGTYMNKLTDVKPSGEEPVVNINPTDFSALVESLFQQKIGQSEEERAAELDADKAAAKGKGVMMDPTTGEYKLEEEMDPKLVEGLKKIGKLDSMLAKKTIQARELSVQVHGEKLKSRMTPEEKEAAMEKAEKLLKKEKQRRRQEMKVKRALETGDISEAERRNLTQGPNARFFHISPEDEALVERLLTEAVEDGENPFEVFDMEKYNTSRPTTSGSEAPGARPAEVSKAAGGGSDAGEGSKAGDADSAAQDGDVDESNQSGAVQSEEEKATAARLAEINSKLENFQREHLWDAEGGLSDYRLPESHNDEMDESEGGQTPRSQTSRGSTPGSMQSKQTKASRAKSTKAVSIAGSAAAPGSVAGGSAMPGSGSTKGSRAGENGEADYLEVARKEREEKLREEDLDAKIRALRCEDTRERGKLTKEQMDELLADCRRQQDALTAPVDPPAAALNMHHREDIAGQGPADITNVEGGVADRKRGDAAETDSGKGSKGTNPKPSGKVRRESKLKDDPNNDNFVGVAARQKATGTRSSGSSTASSRVSSARPGGKPPRPTSAKSQKGLEVKKTSVVKT